MVKGVVEEETWRHEEGWHPARLESVVEERVEFLYKSSHAAVQRGDAKAGEKGSFTKWRWSFTLLGGDYDGDRIRLDTNPGIPSSDSDPRNRIYSAFLGRSLEVGEAFDTDLIEGGVAEVLVAHDLETHDRTGKKFSTITDARPKGEGVIVAKADPWSAEATDDSEPPF